MTPSSMMHPEVNATVFEVVDSWHLMYCVILVGIIRHLPDLCKNVQLMSGNLLDPDSWTRNFVCITYSLLCWC